MDTMMDMGTMSMTATSTGAMSSSTSSSMDMGGMDMGDMDMGQGSCKVSMLWNWDTIDACFLTKSWQITSRGMFAGSCIGVICLVLCLEFLRRIGREYDAFIIRRAKLRFQYLSSEGSSPLATPQNEPIENTTGSDSDQQQGSQQKQQSTAATAVANPLRSLDNNSKQLVIRPTIVEQTVRALLHLFQFAVAYFIMLLAMYFNGYIIICIFIGAFLGAFIFSWEGMTVNTSENDATAVTGCCG